MKPIVRFVAGVIASNALGSFALAQPSLSSPPAVASGFVTLAVATDAAWQRAVEASETQGQRQRADAERVAASSLWAAPPALLFGWRDDRWQTNAGNREAEIALAWPLWLPGQRDARGAAAESAVELAHLLSFGPIWLLRKT